MLNDTNALVLKNGLVTSLNTLAGITVGAYVATNGFSAYSESLGVTEESIKPLANGVFISTASPAITGAFSAQELTAGYQELGEAFSQLGHDDLDDEFKVDDAMYQSALSMASCMNSISIPAPRLFTHGSQAIVFNWTTSHENRYLTISRNSISVLVSDRSTIKRCTEYPFTHEKLADNPLEYIFALWSPKAKCLHSSQSE